MNKTKNKTPGILKLILSLIAVENEHSQIMGDFEEEYDLIAQQDGKLSAVKWVILQIFISIIPFMRTTFRGNIMIIKNYFLAAARNISRNSVHTIINILGLSLGFSICILIFLFVKNEYSFNGFHEHADSVYRVYKISSRPGSPVKTDAETSVPLRNELINNYPEILNSARITNEEEATVKSGENRFLETVTYTDTDLFNIFSFPIIKGNKTSPLKDLNSAVITESAAGKYFREKDPVGKELNMILNSKEFTFRIEAVVKDIPSNSGLSFSILIPYETLKKSWGEDFFESFDLNNPETYIRINSNADPAALEQKLTATADKIKEFYNESYELELKLQPLRDIYLNTGIPKNTARISNPLYSYILSGLAVLILAVAIINYVIISTGKASTRAKEIGIRKVAGAVKGQLQFQFLSESVLTVFLALLAGIVFSLIFLPVFNEFSGRQLKLVLDPLNIIVFFLLALFTGIISGIYPAKYLAGFPPVKAIKGSLKFGSKNRIARILVITQFSITIFLIISALTMRDQLLFLINRNLGFDREHIVTVSMQTSRANAEQFYQKFRNELKKSPALVTVSAESEEFGRRWTKLGFTDVSGVLTDYYVNVVDPGYIKAMGIELICGRDFSTEFGEDKTKSYIVNEACVKYFGWEDPLTGKLPEKHLSDRNIIGVIKDFNFLSLHNKVGPLILALSQEALVSDGPMYGDGSFPLIYKTAVIRIKSGEILPAVRYIEDTWKSLAPGKIFKLNFLDETLRSQYRDEQRWSRIIKYVSIFTITIACLGLFGLSIIIADKRIKEIGIRKTLGASIRKITVMISYDLLKPIITANVIAWPAAYFVINKWLTVFAYKTSLNFNIFLISSVLSVLIAIATISFHTLKAALKNPVDILRHE